MNVVLIDAMEHEAEARDDADLVKRARAGNKQAFGELVERYYPVVCSVAFGLTGNFSRSEEVAQEVFVAAWVQLSALREPDRFRSWVCGIARNLSRRSQRDEGAPLQRRSTPLAIESDIPSSSPSPLDHVLDREEEHRLWGALSAIPETYRVPLVLFYREDLSIERVAEALAISQKSVKTRLWRGRRMLQDNLGAFVESALVRTRPRATKAVAAAVLAAIAIGKPAMVHASVSLHGSKAVVVAATFALVAVALVVGWRWRATGPSATGPSATTLAAREAQNKVPFLARAAPSVPRLTAAAPQEAAALSVPEPKVLVDFDFEDGVLPPGFIEGHVEPGPPRAGNRYCLLGTIALRWKAPVMAVAWNPGQQVFAFSERQVLSFDFFAPRGTPIPYVMIAAPGKVSSGLDKRRVGRNFQFHLAKEQRIREAWTHVEARLSDFAPVGKDAPPFHPGELVTKLQFVAGQPGSGPLFIDNVKIVER